MDRSDDRYWAAHRSRGLARRRRTQSGIHQRSDAAVAVAIALVLAACGGGTSQPKYGVPEDPIPEAEPAKPKPVPKQGFTWATALPSSGFSEATGVAADASDNVYVVGRFTGVMSLGAKQIKSKGGADVFIAQLSAEDGSIGWAQHLGSKGEDETALVAVDPTGDVVVFASIRGKPVVVKYAGADGAEQWSAALTSRSPISARGLAVDLSGDVFVGGTFYAAASVNKTKLFHAGKSDMFIAKLSGVDGSTVWAESIGTPDDNSTRSIAVDGTGNLYVAGSFSGAVNVGDVWFKAPKNAPQMFLASFDGDGKLRWAKQLEVSSKTVVWDLAVDGGGNTALVGVFKGETALQATPVLSRGGYDGFIASYDANGEARWFAQHGAEHSDSLRTADFTLADQAIVTGTADIASSTASGLKHTASGTIHVASYSPTGQLEWTHRADANGPVSPLAAAVDTFGFVYVAGGFGTKIIFGDTTIEAEGSNSAFIAKLLP